jgi:hypothetical protein
LTGATSSISLNTTTNQIVVSNLNINTASLDSRIIAIETAALSASYFSSSIQLTGSFDERYTQTSSLNTFTSSINNYTGSSIEIVNGLMAYTASLKASTIISGAAQITALGFGAGGGTDIGLLNIATASLNSKTGSYATTGSNTFIGTNIFSGSLFMSGSVYGNVTVQPVTSNTSSIDISTANFFTITLGSSVTTHISASNVRAGQSVNILVTTGTNSTASFSTNIKQPSGSFYLPTSGSGKFDILSLVSFDTTSLYLVAVNQMI